MVLKLKIIHDEFIEEIYRESMEELNRFFDINWKNHVPEVIVVEDRKALDKFTGRKTQEWNVAFASNNQIFILSKKNYERDSTHKYSDINYKMLLKHELVHLFLKAYSNWQGYVPAWFEEGLCVYLSGQIKNHKVERFESFFESYDRCGKNVYSEGGFAIKVLIEKLDVEKIMQILRNLKISLNKEDFDTLFSEIYGFSPSYEKFNKML